MSWHLLADSAETGQGVHRQEGVLAVAIGILTMMKRVMMAEVIRGRDHRCSERNEKRAVLASRHCVVSLWTLLGEIGNAISTGLKRQRFVRP
jgi:hypothetical protein